MKEFGVVVNGDTNCGKLINTHFLAMIKNKCEIPTLDALEPTKKGRQIFVTTIHGHNRITLCMHAHFQANRIILSRPCNVMMKNHATWWPNLELKKYHLVT